MMDVSFFPSKILNVVKAGCLEESKVNVNPKNTFQTIENHNLALETAKSIGLNVVNIGWVDLNEKKVKAIDYIGGILFDLITLGYS